MSNGHSIESDGGSSPGNMSSSEGYGQLDSTVAGDDLEMASALEHAERTLRQHSSTTTDSQQGHGPLSQEAELAPEDGLEEDDPEQPELDWVRFQQLCGQQMDQKRQEQADLQHELDELISFYHVWRNRGAEVEETRAAKRLRTRVAYVQNAEQQLQSKREHHGKVLDVFKQALAILQNS